jgi:aminoacrylate hydrolase
MPLAPLRDGARLHYEIVGQGPPLLLVSGLGGLGAFWAPLVPKLAERFTVVTHDHRGTGQSSRTEGTYSIEGMAADVLDLMRHLDIQRADFVGHSTGGAIGQVLALDTPQVLDRMVLSQSWAAADGWFKLLFEARMAAYEQGGPRLYAALTFLFGYPPDWVSAHGAAVEAGLAAAEGDTGPASILPSRIKALLAFDRRAELARITTPTLVIGVRDDLITPYMQSEALHQLIPGARLRMFSAGGHFFPRVEPESFLTTVGGFLRRDKEA